MSSVVCQGLQSCPEPQPRVSRHKLSLPPKSKICQPLPCPQKPNFSQEHQLEKISHTENQGNGCDDSNLKSSKSGGWNFIQALTNSSNNTKQLTDQTEKVYVHPLVKRSAPALSSKSLEMCTESLGSETGSDISSNDEFSLLSCEEEKMQLPNEEFSSISRVKNNVNRSDYREIYTKKVNPSHSFPPPLTSFSGLDGGVQVHPHRSGGRLVIKAVAVSPRHTNFQADRTNGRLRLSLLKECSVNSDTAEIIKEQKEEIVNNEQEEGDQEVLGHGNFNDLTEEEEETDEDEGCWGEEREGKGGKIGSEIGIGELARPSRCKESGRGSKGMSSWGSHFGFPFLKSQKLALSNG